MYNPKLSKAEELICHEEVLIPKRKIGETVKENLIKITNRSRDFRFQEAYGYGIK